jgi:transcriptional regulator with XRE-family HTH domain
MTVAAVFLFQVMLAGYGLRRFAQLISELPSNLSAVESGHRAPWRTTEKLRKVADALALTEGTGDWDEFFIAARKPGLVPPDMERILERDMNLVLLRTVDQAKLSDETIRELCEHIRSLGARRDDSN